MRSGGWPLRGVRASMSSGVNECYAIQRQLWLQAAFPRLNEFHLNQLVIAFATRRLAHIKVSSIEDPGHIQLVFAAIH
jgi:hypothetical protein